MRTGSENQIEVFLIRHGSTKMNEEKRYLGTTDVPLSEAGALAVKEKAKNPEFLDVSNIDYVFSGPMKRVKETAQIFFPEEVISEDEIIEVSEWTEIDFGDFEGKNYIELSDNPDYQKWMDSNGTLPFPNGERREAFIKRSWSGFTKVAGYLNQNAIEGKRTKAACFMHGGNIMAIMYSLFGGEYFNYQAKPAEGYRIVFTVSPKIKIIEIEDLR